MLYEVITELLVVGLDVVVELTVVEPERQLLVELAPARKQIVPAHDPRITSYNVCYTKLLRYVSHPDFAIFEFKLILRRVEMLRGYFQNRNNFV